jgi:hypothetical protein
MFLKKIPLGFARVIMRERCTMPSGNRGEFFGELELHIWILARDQRRLFLIFFLLCKFANLISRACLFSELRTGGAN